MKIVIQKVMNYAFAVVSMTEVVMIKMCCKCFDVFQIKQKLYISNCMKCII